MGAPLDDVKLQNICKNRIESALSAREVQWKYTSTDVDAEVFVDIPERNLVLLQGQYWNRVLYYQQDTPVRRSSNQLLSKLNSKIGMISQGRTEFFVQARRAKYAANAKAAQGLVNAVWQGQGLDKLMIREQVDVEPYGYGVVEIGWRYETGDEVLEGQRGEPQAYEGMSELSPQILAALESNPETGEAPDQGDEESLLWEAKYDDIFVQRVSPRLFWVDPNARSLDLGDARYVVKKEFAPLPKVKNNKKFDRKERMKVKGGIFDVRGANDTVMSVDVEVRPDVALVQLYHLWGWFDLNEIGKDEFLHIVYCIECEKPLLVESSPYDFGPVAPPFPFRVLRGPVVDQDQPYPITSIDQVADLQLAYDESFCQFNELRRKAMRMYIAAKGSLDAEAIRKIEEARDGSLIEVETALIETLRPFPQIPGSAEMYRSLELIPPEITRGMGVSEFDEAVTPEKQMTKAEAVIIQSSGNSRTTGSYERLRDFKAEVAYAILCLYQQFADKNFSYRMTDEIGRTQFVDVNAEILRGVNSVNGNLDPIGIQFVLDVNSDNKSSVNREGKVRTEIQLLTALAPFLRTAMNPMGELDPKPVLKNILQTAEIDDLEEIMRPPEPPQAQPGPSAPPPAGAVPSEPAMGTGQAGLTDGMSDEQVDAFYQMLAQQQGGA